MKKILIIADGSESRAFLQRLENLDTSENIYHIVYYRDTTLPAKRREQFLYYRFDPTSYIKLAPMIEDIDFFQVMLVLGNKIDMQATYDNLRRVDQQLSIVMLDKWDLHIDDPHTVVLNQHERIANLLSNYLPDIPLWAQNIGLGQGEVMEIKIPFGSAYVYRHVGNIEQKRWRIAAIYRNQKIILPEPKTMLMPDDAILAVGNPNVLKGVYKSIKRQFGQFPHPYGQNTYTFIDMVAMNDSQIELLCNDAMLMHAKLNSKKLIIRVVNPRLGKMLDKLKGYHESASIDVLFDFLNLSMQRIVLGDLEHNSIGLFITDKAFFTHHMLFLYRLKIPILKTGNNGFFNIRHSVVLSEESDKIEQLSSVIFDCASQLGLDISFYDFTADFNEEREKIIEHFENLSKLFEEKVRIIKTDKNPIRELLPQDDFLQFVIFEKKLLEPRWMAFFSTDIEKHYFRFLDKYQLFLPYES
ncbi:MAG: potassium transporter TrkA [Sulfurospirillum sp.]|nr:MAG: potassium transporter TrkA [Sulfurospirillum sp.]